MDEKLKINSPQSKSLTARLDAMQYKQSGGDIFADLTTEQVNALTSYAELQAGLRGLAPNETPEDERYHELNIQYTALRFVLMNALTELREQHPDVYAQMAAIMKQKYEKWWEIIKQFLPPEQLDGHLHPHQNIQPADLTLFNDSDYVIRTWRTLMNTLLEGVPEGAKIQRILAALETVLHAGRLPLPETRQLESE